MNRCIVSLATPRITTNYVVSIMIEQKLNIFEAVGHILSILRFIVQMSLFNEIVDQYKIISNGIFY